jgi:hypothetical protein
MHVCCYTQCACKAPFPHSDAVVALVQAVENEDSLPWAQSFAAVERAAALCLPRDVAAVLSQVVILHEGQVTLLFLAIRRRKYSSAKTLLDWGVCVHAGVLSKRGPLSSSKPQCSSC